MIDLKDCIELRDSLEDYENEFGIKLPQDLKEIIKKNNMGHPFPSTFKLSNGEENNIKYFLSFNKDDKMNAYFCKRLEQIPSDTYPFAIDPFGNFICLRKSQIVFFDSETETCQYICPSVSELLKNLY